jgi:hypothetical protein
VSITNAGVVKELVIVVKMHLVIRLSVLIVMEQAGREQGRIFLNFILL